jgi:hypothetical protein
MKQKETVFSLKETIFIPNESKYDFWGYVRKINQHTYLLRLQKKKS